MSSIDNTGTGNVVSTLYTWVSVALAVFPDASVVVTLPSTVVSPSAAKSEPGTLILYFPVASTVPVNVFPFTVNVTVSPALKSPVTVPVTAIVVPASDAFNILSVVMSSIDKETIPPTVIVPVAFNAGLQPPVKGIL